jgi:plastocyanin
MHVGPRWLGGAVLLALCSGLVWQGTTEGVSAQGRVVTIHDNDAPSPQVGFDPRQAQWRYNPDHVEVRRGESVTFRSQPNNAHDHTVTQYVRTSPPFPDPVQLQAGLPVGFDSSPTRETLIPPGGSWTLQTAGLNPGLYAYLCKLHPWMQGVITVTP